MDNENVAIFVGAQNNAGTILSTLQSLLDNDRPPDWVIIGDNDSEDGTYDVLCKFLGIQPIEKDGVIGLPPDAIAYIGDTSVKIFRKRKSSLGNHLNICLKICPYADSVTVIGFVEPGCTYEKNKISDSMRVLQNVKGVAAVTSDCFVQHDDGFVERLFRQSFDTSKFLYRFPYDLNFLTRPVVFQALKAGFNETLEHRVDYEFLVRLCKVGLIYHIPSAMHTISPERIDVYQQQVAVKEEAAIRARELGATKFE